MAKDKVTIVVPNEDEFGPAEIPFGVVSGTGVPDFDHQKSKGKRGGMDYSVTLVLNKKMDKAFRQEVLDYWEANKPKEGGKEPANFENLTRKDKNEKGQFLLYAKSKTTFEIEDKKSGKVNVVENVIPIVNHEGTKLDPEEFGNIGKGSEGRTAVTLAIYGDDEDAGVSVYLSAVKLTKFVAHVGGNAAAAFGAEDGEVSGEGGFKKEKKKSSDDEEKPKKKKKKKKSE